MSTATVTPLMPAAPTVAVSVAPPVVVVGDIFTPAEAAAYLKLDEAAVVAEAAAGRLPARRVGGEWRFSRAAILEWFAMPESSKERMMAVAGSIQETEEEYEAFMAVIQEYRDEVDRATGSGKYAPE